MHHPDVIAVTGANGFLGNSLCMHLQREFAQIRPITRSRELSGNAFAVGEIGPNTTWSKALHGVDVVVHCAAVVHQLLPKKTSMEAYNTVNTLGTLRLAEAAVTAGVRRMVFLSSVKVMGESTAPDQPFLHTSAPQPLDAYGLSKWHAEQGLWQISKETGLEVVVIRPPLVYGPGVGANFQQLMSFVHQSIPLPLASLDNRRSLVSLLNLNDVIRLCIDHPQASGQTFLVSDGQDMSTPDLVRHLAVAMGRSPRLFTAPETLLRQAARLTGRLAQFDRLSQNLQVDINFTRSTLGWEPRYSVEHCLRETVESMLHT